MPSLKLFEQIKLAERSRKNPLGIPDQQTNIRLNIGKTGKTRYHKERKKGNVFSAGPPLVSSSKGELLIVLAYIILQS